MDKDIPRLSEDLEGIRAAFAKARDEGLIPSQTIACAVEDRLIEYYEARIMKLLDNVAGQKAEIDRLKNTLKLMELVDSEKQTQAVAEAKAETAEIVEQISGYLHCPVRGLDGIAKYEFLIPKSYWQELKSRYRQEGK